MAVGGSTLYDLAGDNGFLNVDPAKGGERGTVDAAGLVGSTFLVAFFAAANSAYECLRRYNAHLEPRAAVLLVVAWCSYLLGQAARFFGFAHVVLVPVTPSDLALCQAEARSAAKAMNGVDGFMSLVAWLLSIGACFSVMRQPFGGRNGLEDALGGDAHELLACKVALC